MTFSAEARKRADAAVMEAHQTFAFLDPELLDRDDPEAAETLLQTVSTLKTNLDVIVRDYAADAMRSGTLSTSKVAKATGLTERGIAKWRADSNLGTIDKDN